MNSDTVDYLMSQPDGANYVVLYQMLCLKTINTEGRLARQIGEIIIPYDVEKIQRDCKYFSVDTIRIALNLFKSFGLIYEDVDGTLVLTEHSELVGSETDYAERNRRLRKGKEPPAISEHTAEHNVYEDVSTDVCIEKEIRERDKDKDKEIRDKDTRDYNILPPETTCSASDVQRVIDAWNALGLQRIRKIVPDTDRYNMLRKRIKDYGLEDVLMAVEKVKSSSFLQGNNQNGWQATFDWFIRPNNFPKVLSGNYDNKKPPQNQSKYSAMDDLRELHELFGEEDGQ